MPHQPSGGRTTVTRTSFALRALAISVAISAALVLVSEPSTPTTIAFGFQSMLQGTSIVV
jgi:hypothetical protein